MSYKIVEEDAGKETEFAKIPDNDTFEHQGHYFLKYRELFDEGEEVECNCFNLHAKKHDFFDHDVLVRPIDLEIKRA